MYLEVYPDIVFILNFFIDFFLLFLLKKVNRKSSNSKRLIGAAATGALFAALICIFPWMNVIIRFALMNIAASFLMMRIAFGKLNRSDMLKQVITFYLITYFVGGLLNSVYYYTNLRIYLLRFGSALTLSNLSIKVIFGVLLLFLPIALYLIWMFRRYQGDVQKAYDVELYLDNRSVYTKGLVDTGNSLYDPIFKKPVIVVEHSLIKQLLSEEFLIDIENAKNNLENKDYDAMKWNMKEEHILRFRYIPYQSIGKAQGMMLGLVMDKVLIHTGMETICNEKVITAICDNQLSTKEEYHVILHKQLL